MPARPPESYLHELFKLLPRGPIWPTLAREGSVWEAFLDAIANEFARIDYDQYAWLADFFPDKTIQQLPDWERLLGLPDCGIPLGTLSERRGAVLARLRRRGTPTLASIQLAADGFANGAVVNEGDGTGDLFEMDLSGMGDPIDGDSAGSAVLITYDDPQSDVFECTMRHLIPVHLTVVFEVNP